LKFANKLSAKLATKSAAKLLRSIRQPPAN